MLCELDPVYTIILDKYGSPPQWSRPPGFVSLVKLILEQQVSIDSAKAAYDKLEAFVGVVNPSSVVELSADEWRACTISRQKGRYIRLLGEEVMSGMLDLSRLADVSDQMVFDRLTAITGIGPWTARVYLLFCLQRRDVWPTGDIALIRTTMDLWEVERSAVDDKASDWSPYRSLATFCQWHYYLSERGRKAVY